MVNKKFIAIIIIVIIAVIGIVYAYNTFVNDDNETIHIGYRQSAHLAPLFVANATGMFKAAGLNIEMHEYNNGGDLLTAMASGEIDVGYAGATPTLSSIEKGVPVKMVSAVHTGGSGLVAHDSNVTSIEDLKGKTIATPGKATTQYMLLQYDLKKHGMNISDINSPGMKVASMNDALKGGSIDAMLTWEPYVSIAEKVNNQNVLERSNDIYEDYPCCVIVVSDKLIQNHPEQVKQIVDINAEATEKIKADPYGAVQYLPSTMIVDEEVEGDVLANTIIWGTGLNDTYKQSVHDWIDVERDLGFLNRTFTDDELFYDPNNVTN